jgi:cysteine synthase B
MTQASASYPTIETAVGQTPLVAIRRVVPASVSAAGNVILGKLEGNNPAGSVKDRPALSMIARAEARGEIKPGDTLIEATSGNTGIALAMAAAIRGYRMVLIMPDNLSIERRQAMKAFGAELILVTQQQGMEGARDLADQMQAQGQGRVLDQFANDDNWMAHYQGTGPEIWEQTQGRVTHFVSAMGTTGTITGVSRYLKERNPAIQIIGAQPSDGSSIPGIRKWSPEYVPPIRSKAIIDQIAEVSQADAEAMARRLAVEDGLFCGPSAAGACQVAIRLAQNLKDATVVFIVCDRGDRYLSTGLFPG